MYKHTNWIFVIKNYNQKDIDIINKWDCLYVIFAKEKEEGNMPCYLHGFLQISCSTPLNFMKKIYHQSAQWEYTHGKVSSANIKYCSISQDITERGTPVINKRREDLKDAVIMTIAGETTEAIFNQHGAMYIKYKNEVDEMARCICTEKTLKC